MTSVPAAMDLKALFSTDGQSKAKIRPRTNGEPALIQLDYGQPFTARSLTYSSRVEPEGAGHRHTSAGLVGG